MAVLPEGLGPATEVHPVVHVSRIHVRLTNGAYGGLLGRSLGQARFAPITMGGSKPLDVDGRAVMASAAGVLAA